MVDILSISELPAYVLKNSEATHFFISIAFIAKSRIAYEETVGVLQVTITSGKTLPCQFPMQKRKTSCEGFLVNILRVLHSDGYFNMI